MQTLRYAVYLLTLALFTCALPAVGQARWDVKNTLHVGGEGGWDYLTVDPETHRLFVPRGTHTMVLDSATGKMLGDIPGQKIAHGVALVPALHRGFITDGGGDGAIIIFNLDTYAVLGRLATVPDSDGIIYDASLGRILAVSGDKGLLMSFKPDIDPRTDKIDTFIPLGGAPEFLASDGKGMVYINLEDKDLVAEVDLARKQVVARWPVAPGGHPVGLALDRASGRLFIGCRNPQKMVVMSTKDGTIVGSVPIGAGVDATIFNQGQAFASCRDGSLVVAGETSGKYLVEEVVKTPPGARTMGIDLKSQTIYLPTAEFESDKSKPASARPSAKPGSFMIVQVGRTAGK